MSNVYIISAARTGVKPSKPSIVLKLSSSQQAKKVYRSIKEQLPKAHLGVFGAFHEENKQLDKITKHSRLVDNAADFIKAVRTCGTDTYYKKIAL